MSSLLPFIVLTILLSVLLSSCETSSKEEGRISGTVALYGESDHSGVKISLYSLEKPDSVLSRIRREHSHIGVEFSQENMFDHTNSHAIYNTESDENGVFNLENVKPGVYNLVAVKEGWSHRYIYGIDVSAKSKEHISYPTNINRNIVNHVGIGTIAIYPITILSGIYSDEFVFRKDHVYYASQEVIFESHVVVEGGTEVRLGEEAGLRFLSTVSSLENGIFAKFLAKEYNKQDIKRWVGIKLHSDNNIIDRWIVRSANTGIHILGSNSNIENTIFELSGVGIQAEGKNVSLTNCFFNSTDDRGFGLIQSSGSDEIEYVLHNNIFYKVHYGVRTMGHAVSIMHNYFIECTEGIGSYHGYHIISRNSFHRNENSINCYGSEICISDNNFFENNVSISLEKTHHQQPTSNPQITNNNFFQTRGYAIRLRVNATMNNINAKLNFWHEEDIESIILDSNNSQNIPHSITYLPKLYRVIQGIGA